MKICHVLWGLAYGGIETMVSNIANVQAAEGHEVSMLVINDLVDSPMLDMIDPKVNVVFVGRPKSSKNPWHVLKANLLLFKLSPDIVHFHHPALRRLFIKPIIRSECNTLHSECIPSISGLVRKLNNLCAISQYVHDDILQQTGHESTVIENGIVVNRYRHRSDWFDGNRQFRILQLGRVDISVKGQDIFVKAVKEVIDNGIAVSCDIIGEGHSLPELKTLIAQLGLNDRVSLLGAKSQEYVREHLADYDLVVHPSRHEGFGLVIVEAMAAKVPTLVSDIESQLELIDHGDCGYSFKNEDVHDMANKIQQIISNYDIKLIHLAYKRVNSEYHVERTAQEYLSYYAKVVQL